VLTDPGEIRRLARTKRGENLDFRRHLKAHHCPEEAFHILADEVAAQIDCTRCANCCREMIVNVSAEDVARIAAHLRMPVFEVARQYVESDPDEPSRRVLINRANSCVFLDGNLCLIYDARPKPCREFPNLVSRSRSLGGRMASVCRHAEVCPIVYNTLEEYKREVGYRPKPHHPPPAV
jgi:hypothetical protein